MDIRLLIKKITGSLDVEEDKTFAKWYQSSAEHRKYFNKFKTSYKEEEEIYVDTKKGWEELNSKLIDSSRSYWKYLVAAIFLIGAFSLPFYYFMIDRSGSQIEVVNQEPEMIDEVIFIDQEGNSVVFGKEDSLKGNYYNVDKKTLKINNSSKSTIGKNTITVPHGKQFNVELSDGTIVYLNALSKFIFPSNFQNQDFREVELVYGEAFFEVSPASDNRGKKFIVKNKNQSIEVVGTSFNIQNYSENEVVTTLVEGKINLQFTNEEIGLEPGEQSIVKSKSLKSIKKVNVQDYVAWKNGMFIFNEKTLKEIFTVLSRWYDIDVEFENKKLERIKFDGRFKNELELEKIIELIENTKQARFELNGNTIKVMPY